MSYNSLEFIHVRKQCKTLHILETFESYACAEVLLLLLKEMLKRQFEHTVDQNDQFIAFLLFLFFPFYHFFPFILLFAGPTLF